MCKEDNFVLRLMYLEGFREVKLNHTLKFPEKGLLDKILRFVVVGILVNKAFVLWWCQWVKKRDGTEGEMHPDKVAVPHQGLWLMKCPSMGSITSIVELNSSPFCQHTRNILSGCCRRDLLINGIRAAPCHDKIDKLPLKTGVNRECPLRMCQSILGIC